MKYRNEWKYICKDSQIIQIENKLDRVLIKDEHANLNNTYYIHSLYFDDYKNSCAKDNDLGINNRYKWRIRYYNNDISNIRLERKEKYNGLTRKKTSKLSLEQYYNILNNNITNVFWNTDDKLLKNFCIDIENRLFRPKVIVDYERIAYVEPISNIRITFDKNICASREIDKFLSRDYIKHPLQLLGNHVMEVKFDDILPSYIKKASNLGELQQTTFSKYYLSRNLLERV